MAALTVALPDLTLGGHVVVLTALTVLGHNFGGDDSSEDATGSTTGSDGSAEAAAPAGGGSAASAFIDRVVRSTFDRRAEFGAVELSWLVEECLPRLDGEVYRLPIDLAAGLARELMAKSHAVAARGAAAPSPAAAGEAGVAWGGHGDDGAGAVVAQLAEYVSPGLLHRAWRGV
jgi:hypothetical protein